MYQKYSPNYIENGAFGVQIGMPSGNPGRAMNSCRTSVASNLMAFVLHKNDVDPIFGTFFLIRVWCTTR
jgi:hypothetical protein